MSENRQIDFLGIPLDTLTLKETMERIEETIREGGRLNHVVINAGKVVAMQSNKELFQSVVSCDLINADGQSIVWAVRILGKKIPERVAGIDLMENLVELAAERGYGCFFFGAREEVVRKVVELYTRKYGASVVAGYRNGYFERSEEAAIAQMIGDSRAQLLFVAMPSPKKENFMFEYRDVMRSLNFNMGVGGSFDVIAGYTNRAPLWMQKIGLEWFYRFLQEPGRMWKRYLVGNTMFILLVLKAKFRKQKAHAR